MSKITSKWLSVFLCAVMMVSVLTACGEQENKPAETKAKVEKTEEEKTEAEEKEEKTEAEKKEEKTEEKTEEEEPEEATEAEKEKEDEKDEKAQEDRAEGTLVIGMSEFTEKFSPFYATTAYDREIADWTQVSLLTTDRQGEIVYNGIEGEERAYNGNKYFYDGIADLEVEQSDEKDDAGLPLNTVYTFKFRDDIKFSDGEPLTMDDVVFSFYAYIDPAYTGSATLSTLPIIGLEEYRTQTDTALYNKYLKIWDAAVAAGPAADKAASEDFTEEEYDKIWGEITAQAKEGSNQLYDMMEGMISDDYVNAAFGEKAGLTAEDVKADEGLVAAFALKMWNLFTEWDEETGKIATSGTNEQGEEVTLEFNINDNKPTKEDVYNAGRLLYGSNDYDYIGSELTDFISLGDMRDTFINESGKEDPDAGEAVTSVEGFKIIDDNSFSLTLKGFDASAVYKVGFQVSPLHYYGDKDQFKPEEGLYGHPFKDLSLVEAKTKEPMGAGPYIFEKFENKIVYMTANPHYYKGSPKIQSVQFKTTPEKDRIIGLESGIIDVTDPSFSKDRAQEIKNLNDTGEITGDTITTYLVDNLGYGYIGICAGNVKVGDDPASEESKNLRRAFATVFAEERALAVDSFYGEAASVIEYPISNTSWAAPKPGDEGYKTAFSEDVEGNPIYEDGMDEKAKREAAKEAAIGYLKAAGYTFDEAEGKFTAAPAGAKMQYTIIVPGEGTGDHPSFKLITEARNILEEIGIVLDINDPANAGVLWDTLDAGTQEMWCAAWQAGVDPDMYQIYHSSSILNRGGTNNNHYMIEDPELDELIIEARQSEDHEFRKSVYKTCLDILIDWAVEIPVYQRQNCTTISTQRVDIDTVTPDITTFWGWSAEVHTLAVK